MQHHPCSNYKIVIIIINKVVMYYSFLSVFFIDNSFKTIVYPELRHKFGGELENWKLNDNSVASMIRPWVNVFPEDYMKTKLLKHVVPKLENALHHGSTKRYFRLIGTNSKFLFSMNYLRINIAYYNCFFLQIIGIR